MIWLHTLSPFVVRFWDDVGIRWYGLAYLAGFGVAYLLLRWLSKRRLIAIPYERVGDALIWFIGGALVGGRLGYALVYDPALFYHFSGAFPWWGLLAINQGGMASHGGMVGVIIAGWIVSRWNLRTPPPESAPLTPGSAFMHVCDVVAFICPAGLFFGRLANFVNGELLGKIVAKPGEAAPWWAVQYPQELDLCHTDPVTLATSPGRELVQTPEQWNQVLRLAETLAPAPTPEGLREGLHRLAHEAWRHSPQLNEQLKTLVSSRHPSQLYQAAAEGLVLGAVLWLAWARPRKPGVIGSVFLIVYGILRILTELIRLPDAQLVTQRWMGLSRGQWLSVGMIVAGVAVIGYAARRAGPRLGGWAGRGKA
ncbi:MAG TPA: prolipoprotein diacylglyceryl transferase [Phycisphaerales bacterium]|nr:prolipoprotein diacylglyceryl transferase [Phycisphaerales bacterium]